jgi:tRNA A64-2'-O-ribosylphosphate transferase
MNYGARWADHPYGVVCGASDMVNDERIMIVHQGLTPQLFWRHRAELLACSRDALEELVAHLVATAATAAAARESERSAAGGESGHHGHGAWRALPTPVTKVGGRVLLCAVEDLPRDLPVDLHVDLLGTSDDDNTRREKTAFVIVDESDTRQPDDRADETTLPPEPEGRSLANVVEALRENGRSPSNVLRVHLPPGKRGQHVFVHDVLLRVVSFSSSHLLGLGKRICVAGGGDGGTGVALVLLQLFFDDNGRMDTGAGAGGSESGTISKSSVRTRLEWIIADRPDVNPSRAILKRVNNFLLSPRWHGR